MSTTKIREPTHKLVCLQEPPDDYYKDEGGKQNHFPIKIALQRIGI